MDCCRNSLIENNHFLINNDCICRCCLATNTHTEFKPIFSPIGSIPQAIFLFTAVKIEENDNLPKTICISCINHLNKCITFKQRVESSEFLLQNLLANPQKIDTDHDYAKSKENSSHTDLGFNDDHVLEKYNDQVSSSSCLTKKLCTRSNPVCNENEFCCNQCRKKFVDKENLDNHQICHLQNKLSAESPTKPTYTCSTCEDNFAVKEDLFAHSSLHDDSNGFICKSCNKKFVTFFKLKRHVPSHFQEKPFKCKLCEMRFVEMASLTRHFRVHTGVKPKSKHFCMICKKNFPNRYTLKVHNRSHTGERPWKCDVCEKCFSDFRLLNSHKKVHDKRKPHKCKECNRSFRHRSTLVTHMRVHTTSNRPYRCDHCNKSFKQSWRLQIHKRQIHNRVQTRRFICDRCCQIFVSAIALQDHLQWHGKNVESNNGDDAPPKEAPSEFFQCNECSAQFSSGLDLITHQKLTHALRHECFTCFGKWKTIEELVRHKCGEVLKALEDEPSPDEMILLPNGQIQDCNTVVDALLASVSQQPATTPNDKDSSKSP